MSLPTRRQLLWGSGGLVLGAALPSCANRSRALAPVPALPEPAVAPPPAPPPVPVVPADTGLLPVPDLSEARILRFVAGVRPYRRGTVRFEREAVEGRTVVHNYGHGGSGFTLAFGCAEDVTEAVLELHAPPEPVAVLGAGVIGLTCAQRLRAAGFPVRVLAREMPPDTTSDLAGAQWAPSIVAHGRTQAERARFERWLRRSFAAYAALEGERYGILRRPNYTTLGAGGGLRAIPSDLIPPSERLDRLPFPGVERPGELFHTLLIEPPRFLPALVHDLTAAGVELVRTELTGPEAALALPERVLVNCLGLGGAILGADPALQPIRGQLVHLEPQDLPYLLSHSGYLFPRSDAVVLGGTVERGVEVARPDPARCRSILANHRRFFAT
ncbi:MAG: FAD-dependent oxidoreductase [Planctomycetota bacterium]